jgi:hypothetical protein
MKKLILILLVCPLFSFSQTLIKDVYKMSYLDTPKNIHKSTDVLSNMTIYVDSGYLFIKDDLETLKYKVTDSYLSDINGKETTVYEILIEEEKYFTYVSYVKDSIFLYLKSLEGDDASFFYEKRG